MVVEHVIFCLLRVEFSSPVEILNALVSAQIYGGHDAAFDPFDPDHLFESADDVFHYRRLNCCRIFRSVVLIQTCSLRFLAAKKPSVCRRQPSAAGQTADGEAVNR